MITRVNGARCEYNAINSGISQSTGRNHQTKRYKNSANKMAQHFGLFVAVFVTCLLRTAHCNVDSNDIQNYLNTVEETPSLDVAKEPVSVMWGLADATAVLGKLFSYQIPANAFKGDVTTYKVVEAGTDSLPSWLHYDSTTQTIEGVPTPGNLGQHYIEVTANSKDQSSQDKDVFSINVMEDASHTSAMRLKVSKEGFKPIKCQTGSPVTMVTVAIDTNFDGMVAKEKIDLLKSMVSHLKLSNELLKITPMGNRPLFDSDALVAGPGDAKDQKDAGAFMAWEVGCGNVEPKHMEVLQQVESSAQDGSMRKAIKYPIIGWHVTNKSPPSHRRLKRQAAQYVTATAVQPSMAPTKTPIETVVVEEPKDTETKTDEPTRVIPTMESPTFVTGIHPTKSRHHRTKTAGRHKGRKSKHHHPKQSPRSKHHHRSKHPKLPIVTATQEPIAPTKLVDFTEMESSSVYTAPTDDVHMSRTDIIEPSVTLSSTKTKPTKTEALPPSRTFTQDPSPTSTEFRPTKTEPVTVAPSEEYNFEPISKNNIDVLYAKVGEVFKFHVPMDTFYDVEDGTTENLKLVFLTAQGFTLPASTWVKFDQEKQTLYGLAWEKDVGVSEYILAAIDSQGKMARQSLEIVIQDRQDSKPPTHEMAFTLDLDYDKFINDVDMQILVANKISAMFGDSDSSKLTVTKIAKGSVIYQFTNNSMPDGNGCPADEINRLVDMLLDEDGKLKPEIVEKLKPIEIKNFTLQRAGPCKDDDRIKPVVAKPPGYNFTPYQSNPIDKLTARAGRFFRYRIPKNTFTDPEDGNTRKLKLLFLTVGGYDIPPNSWIKLDEQKQTLYGLPLKEDVGRDEFILAGIDRGEKIVRDAFEIFVEDYPEKDLTHTFSLTLDKDYDKFSKNVDDQINVGDKIAAIYGDSNERFITVESIKPGSTIFTWYNNSYMGHPCPTAQVAALLEKLSGNTDNLLPEVRELFSDIPITKFELTPLGACEKDKNFTNVIITDIPVGPRDVETRGASNDEVWITTVVPAVVIAAMLLLAGIIACILYRKKRKGKLSDEDQNTFVNKGIPIIFADELEEKPETPTKPLILEDEKPPLPPPEYRRSSCGSGAPSTPLSDHKEPIGTTDDEDNERDEYEQLLYQPPPPFPPNGNNRNARPNRQQQQYKSPPPYVPP